jgi:signal transduction histidine kinase
VTIVCELAALGAKVAALYDTLWARMRRVRLGIILTALLLVTSLPLAGLAAWLARDGAAQQQALIAAQNVEKVRGISAALDLEVERSMGALVALTTLQPIDSQDLSHFTEIAARIVPLNPSWRSVRLIDPSLRIVANTEPSATTLVQPDWVRQIFATGKNGVSTVRQDPDGQWVVNVGVPVIRGPDVRYVLAARLRATALADFLQRQTPPEGGVITLVDATPVIVARTRNLDRFIGRPPTADFVERSRSGTSGSWRTVLLEGTPAYSAWHRSPVTGWTVGLGMPSEAIDTPLRRRMISIVTAAAVTLTFGVLLAVLLGRSIVRAQMAALEERDAANAALNRAKDDFIATVSHELRTPLNAIYGWVAMLRTGSLDRERQAHALKVIERNAKAQARVVDDLLDMSTIIRGRMRLERTPVDLAQVVRTAVDTVRPADVEPGTTVAVRTAAEPIIVEGDAARLQQVVWNLVANAMKFTGPEGRIEVTVDRSPTEAIVKVTDNGEGIAPEFLPYVFDRFRQESEQATRQHPGLGIGLALARTLTEMHGGTIAADSRGKGQGATFIVRLPLAPDTRDIASPWPSDGPAAGPK